MRLLSLGPEPSASANSATRAINTIWFLYYAKNFLSCQLSAFVFCVLGIFWTRDCKGERSENKGQPLVGGESRSPEKPVFCAAKMAQNCLHFFCIDQTAKKSYIFSNPLRLRTKFPFDHKENIQDEKV